MSTHAFPLREEAGALVNASPLVLFELLDDHRRLSAHMEKSSWMMLGSRMELRLDAGGGRAVGSRIHLGSESRSLVLEYGFFFGGKKGSRTSGGPSARKRLGRVRYPAASFICRR